MWKIYIPIRPCLWHGRRRNRITQTQLWPKARESSWTYAKATIIWTDLIPNVGSTQYIIKWHEADSVYATVKWSLQRLANYAMHGCGVWWANWQKSVLQPKGWHDALALWSSYVSLTLQFPYACSGAATGNQGTAQGFASQVQWASCPIPVKKCFNYWKSSPEQQLVCHAFIFPPGIHIRRQMRVCIYSAWLITF